MSDARQRFFEEALDAAQAFVESASLADPSRVVFFANGVAYDVTDFVETHPGGPDVLRHYRGKDATVALRAFPHSKAATSRMREKVIFSAEPRVATG